MATEVQGPQDPTAHNIPDGASADTPDATSTAAVDGPALEVLHPATFIPERRYAIETFFEDLIGLPVSLRPRAGLDRVEIRRSGSDHRVTIADGLFSHPEADWPHTLPPRPDRRVQVGIARPDLAARLIAPWVPRLWGPDAGEAVREEEGTTHLAVDVFGTAFALLTGLEELYGGPRDRHGRLRAGDGLAGQGGFLDRPILDELAALVVALLTQRWPDLPIPARRPTVFATHDVDRPFGTWGRSLTEVLGYLKGDLLQRRSPSLALARASSLVRTRLFGPQADFHCNFRFIMDVSQHLGLTSTFLFIDRRGEGFGEPRYDLTDPPIEDVIRAIGARGHRLGLHGSYTSFDDADRLGTEYRHLQSVIARQGIQERIRLGRQHYLRFGNPASWRAAVAAGLSEDSTFGYADHPGFRAGTARPYRVFDVMARARLPLVERPLLFMEGSCFGYLGYGWAETRRMADRLAARAFRYGGDFVFLWHPSMLNTPRRRRGYRRLLQGWVRQAAAAGDDHRSGVPNPNVPP